MILCILHTLVKASLVKPVQPGQMDLQPPQAGLAERLRLSEGQEPATEVIADVVQVRWNRVCPTTEIDVVWEVEGIIEILQKRE